MKTCEKWIREASEMSYINTARKFWTTRTTTSGKEHNIVNTNDDADTPHFDDRVAHHNMHWACTHSLTVLDHTHFLGSSWVLHLSPHLHGHPHGLFLFDSTYSTFYFPAFLLSAFLFPFFHVSDERQPKLNKKLMENLHNSANNGCGDTCDVLYLPTENTASFPHPCNVLTSFRPWFIVSNNIAWAFQGAYFCRHAKQ